MTTRIRSIALLAVFVVVLMTESSFAFSAAPVLQSSTYAAHSRNVTYRRAPAIRRPRSGTKMRAALRIAAPAAVGAGIGALAGGKKGAAVGALLGGGGGAAYHLYKSRRQRY